MAAVNSDHLGNLPACDYPEIPFQQMPQYEDNSEDWIHDSRWQVQEILPGVFVGPCVYAVKKAHGRLNELGITHLVCIQTARQKTLLKPQLAEHFQYLVVEYPEKLTAGTYSQVLCRCKAFIDECLRAKGKCLVYCMTGNDYSPQVLTGYIMETFGTSAVEAFRYIQGRRLSVGISDWAFNQLLAYEALYLARRQISSVEPAQVQGVGKRKIDDVEPDEDTDMVMAVS